MKTYTPFTVRTKKGWFNSTHFIDYTSPAYDFTEEFMQVGGKRDYAEYIADRLNWVYNNGVSHGVMSNMGKVTLV